MQTHAFQHTLRSTPVRDLLKGLSRLPLLWMRRHRFRQELAHLDAAQLKDAGLSPERVREEIAKPFWQQ
jgi:uncharacterized protein YjiS (DUF1127 family)